MSEDDPDANARHLLLLARTAAQRMKVCRCMVGHTINADVPLRRDNAGCRDSLRARERNYVHVDNVFNDPSKFFSLEMRPICFF